MISMVEIALLAALTTVVLWALLRADQARQEAIRSRALVEHWGDIIRLIQHRLANAESAWSQGLAVYQEDGCIVTVDVRPLLEMRKAPRAEGGVEMAKQEWVVGDPVGEADVPDAFRRAFGE